MVLLDQAESWLALQCMQIKTIADTSSSEPNYAEIREFHLSRGYEAMKVPSTLRNPQRSGVTTRKGLKS